MAMPAGLYIAIKGMNVPETGASPGKTIISIPVGIV